MEPTRRKPHQHEKHRRDGIRDCFDKLQQALPELRNSRARVSRERIIRTALRFIRDAKAAEPFYVTEIPRLEKAIAELKGKDASEISAWRESRMISTSSDESASWVTTDSSEEDNASDLEDTESNEDLSSETTESNEDNSSDYEDSESNEDDESSKCENVETIKADKLSNLETLKTADAELSDSQCPNGQSVSEMTENSRAQPALDQPLSDASNSRDTKTAKVPRGRPRLCISSKKKQIRHRRM